MGFTLAQAIDKAKGFLQGRAYATFVLATNQDDGIVTYGIGELRFTFTSHPQTGTTYKFDGDLGQFFSDRIEPILVDPGAPQPFFAKKTDSLGLTIMHTSKDATTPVGVDTVRATFTLRSWGGGQFNVTLKHLANILYGVGPAIGQNSREALYTISIKDVYQKTV